MPKFRLLHITDLHISIPPDNIDLGDMTLWMALQTAFPSRARRPLLEAVAALAFQLRGTIDTFVLSGDLADDGETRNLEAALSFVEEPSEDETYLTADEFPTLYDPNRTDGQLFILPGNHDRFRTAVRRLPGGTEFDSVFGSYWKKGLGGVQSLTLFKSQGKLSLIAADFCIQSASDSPLNLWGQGMAYRGTIDLLVEMTNKVRADYPDSGVLWVLHFPPLLDVEPSLALRAASDVIDAARTIDVRYILAGHLHRDQQNPYDGVEVICTGSAASDMNERYGNSIRLLDIELTGGNMTLMSTSYRYVAHEAAFIEK